MDNLVRRMTQKTNGQTLVEIVVVIGVVVVLTTALLILTTYSIKTSRLSALKSQATKYAAEGMEFTRQRRDAGWTDFRALDKSDWCLNDGGGWTIGVCTENVQKLYTRDVEFAWDDAAQRMNVTVTVGWQEGGNYYSSQLQSFFTEWQ